ncbi:hypothetical protein D3C75_658690 [compost metagenome]
MHLAEAADERAVVLVLEPGSDLRYFQVGGLKQYFGHIHPVFGHIVAERDAHFFFEYTAQVKGVKMHHRRAGFQRQLLVIMAMDDFRHLLGNIGILMLIPFGKQPDKRRKQPGLEPQEQLLAGLQPHKPLDLLFSLQHLMHGHSLLLGNFQKPHSQLQERNMVFRPVTAFVQQHAHIFPQLLFRLIRLELADGLGQLLLHQLQPGINSGAGALAHHRIIIMDDNVRPQIDPGLKSGQTFPVCVDRVR